MNDVVFRRGTDFDAEAALSGYFESEDQIRLAARALERAGFLVWEQDEHGRSRLKVVMDVTDADLAFTTAAEHRRWEEGH